ncbi:cation-translocating P-type ATPase [Buchananella hordeovulneris]|uniref:Haloacid dehalogenase n=2 Tax=Buchananella hordeovulneris TaxID=52770 RepID=A0A1Q5PXK8_9ACTO|nr:cation-translocating P-type ATPase [Buchananella hordeovulneris]OKL52348.1 haloacid dehalogenase [Buchananella hordeovulneris]
MTLTSSALSSLQAATTAQDELLQTVQANPQAGLTQAEAAARLAADGPNELRGKPPVPWWKSLAAQFKDPLVYLLFAAVLVSSVAWVLEGAHGWPIEPIVILAIVVLNALLGFAQEAKAADAVAALANMTEAMSTVQRGGSLVTIPARELVRGDILVLAEGDSIGADARLLSATALRVTESALTGESVPAEKAVGQLEGEVPLGDRTNMVFKGTAVVQGVGRAVVTGTGMQTEMGKIAHMLDEVEAEETPLTKELHGVSKMLGVAVISIALIVMLTIVLVNGVGSAQDMVTVLLLGVSLAVAAVPEGLPAILSVVLAMGVRRMAARKAVVKQLHSVETLGSASVICSDKTGTLTRNEMTLVKLVTASGSVDFGGTGYTPSGSVDIVSDDPEAAEKETVFALAAGAVANNAQLEQKAAGWEIQGDPTEAAFLVAVRKLAAAEAGAARFARHGEVPFTSERKRMSVIASTEDGENYLLSKGGPDVLLDRCSAVFVGGNVLELTNKRRAEIEATVESLSAQALRTMGLAYKPVTVTEAGEEIEEGLVYLGTAGIIDPPREEAVQAVAEAHRAGITVNMITGDHPITAGRIASELGICEPGAPVLTGAELDALDEQGFAQAARDVHVFARVAPEHKLRLIDAMQHDGSIVAMTGDGVNDAPALKSADIGIAMGITGTEVTKEAAKMILADDNFATIVSAVRQGRVIFDNIRKFLRYLLSSNMGEVLTVFLGVIFAGWIGLAGSDDGHVVLPLLATQILWINLVTDSGPALAMGVDPETDDVMARRPRKLTDRIIDIGMWGTIIFNGLVMAVTTLFVVDFFLPGGMLAGTDSLATARTAGFTTLVLAQLFNALNSRSDVSSAFHRFFAGPWLWGSIVLGFVLQIAVVEVPFLQRAFGTTSLDLKHWLVALAASSVVLWAAELRKLVRRQLAGKRA